MQIAQLEKSTSLAEIAVRVYRLNTDDPRIAAAVRALAAANPHLTGHLSAMPPQTPVVVPRLPGLSVTISNPVNPSRAALVNVLESLQKTAEQASNAQVTGSTTGPPPPQDRTRQRALERLRGDIETFAKTHAT